MIKIKEIIKSIAEKSTEGEQRWYKIADWLEMAKCKKCGKYGRAWVLIKIDFLGVDENYLGATVLCSSCLIGMRNIYERDVWKIKFWDYCNKNGGLILCLSCGWSDVIFLDVASKVDRELLYQWFDNKKRYHHCDHYLP
jgi:hypothetical protein